MSRTYYIGDITGTRLTGQSLQIARVLQNELEGEEVTHRGLQGLIRLAADAVGIGKYVEVDRVLSDLTDSGFLTLVPAINRTYV